jgi:hypothetical protein
MRHANSNITMNIYTHAVSSKKRRQLFWSEWRGRRALNPRPLPCSGSVHATLFRGNSSWNAARI